MSYGFASNLRDALPHASFIGFTGTPIEKTDAIFGDYISMYEIQRALAQLHAVHPLTALVNRLPSDNYRTVCLSRSAVGG